MVEVTCPKCGVKYRKVPSGINERCPHVVVLDDNPLSIASYQEEFGEL